MKGIETKLKGCFILEPTVFEDSRGYFFEAYHEDKIQEILGYKPTFVQDNQSSSKKGVLRGLHYQLGPHTQGKLVCVTQGAAFDVAVDIRVGSPTFGKWYGVELSAMNKKMLWIPEGFAHGFLALEDDTCFNYKTTNYYNKDSERSLLWNDPALGIEWPAMEGYLISEKDQRAPLLRDADLLHI